MRPRAPSPGLPGREADPAAGNLAVLDVVDLVHVDLDVDDPVRVDLDVDNLVRVDLDVDDLVRVDLDIVDTDIVDPDIVGLDIVDVVRVDLRPRRPRGQRPLRPR